MLLAGRLQSAVAQLAPANGKFILDSITPKTMEVLWSRMTDATVSAAELQICYRLLIWVIYCWITRSESQPAGLWDMIWLPYLRAR
jgi:hypothetical protein